MRSRARVPSLSALLAVLVFGPACQSHLTKLPITEVPIAELQGTPVAAPAADPVVPAVVDTETPAAAASVSAAASSAAAASPGKPAGPPPAAIEASATPEEKVDAAIKLMKSGKRADLAAARKLLYSDVASGNCTPNEAKMLRNVCARLGDKPCVAKAAPYIK